MTQEYKCFRDRIHKADTVLEYRKLEKSLIRLYNAGIFTVNEFSRLDTMIFERICKTEVNAQ